MKRAIIISCFAVLLAGCSSSAATPAETVQPTENKRAADIVEGTYIAEAVLYNGNIVLLKDNSALADLYDLNWVSVYNDGTFGIQDGVFWKSGNWDRIKIEDYENTYLFSQTESAKGTAESHSEASENKHSYIGYLTNSDTNTFVLVDENTADSEIVLIYVREGTKSTYLSGSSSTASSSNSSSNQSSASNSSSHSSSNSSSSGSSTSSNSSSYAISSGERNALQTAKDYIKYMPFSREGLIEQLEYEGYTHSEAVYGADNCGADWYEQAVLMAEQYLEYMSFSYSDLYEQLLYEGFTEAEARHGVDTAY